MMKGLVQFVLVELFGFSLQFYEARNLRMSKKPHFWLLVIVMVILMILIRMHLCLNIFFYCSGDWFSKTASLSL